MIATSGLRDFLPAGRTSSHTRATGRTLVLSASRDSALAQQLDTVQTHSATVATLAVSPDRLSRMADLGKNVIDRLLVGGGAVIAIDPSASLNRDPVRRNQDAQSLTALLAEVSEISPHGDQEDLPVTMGGDLAHACIDRTGAPWLWLAGEFAPGLVMLKNPGGGPRLALRSGGFGDPRALVRLVCPDHSSTEDD